MSGPQNVSRRGVSGSGRTRKSTYHPDFEMDTGDLGGAPAPSVSGGVFKNAALEILKQEERLMTSGEITKLAMERNLLRCMGKTPENTMASALYTEVRKKASTTPFIKPKEGLFGLKCWLNEPWLLNWLAHEGIAVSDLLDPQLPEPNPKKMRTSYNGTARAGAAAAATYYANAAPAGGSGGGTAQASGMPSGAAARASYNGYAGPTAADVAAWGRAGMGPAGPQLPSPEEAAVGPGAGSAKIPASARGGMTFAASAAAAAAAGVNGGAAGQVGTSASGGASDISSLHLLIDAADEIEAGPDDEKPPAGVADPLQQPSQPVAAKVSQRLRRASFREQQQQQQEPQEQEADPQAQAQHGPDAELLQPKQQLQKQPSQKAQRQRQQSGAGAAQREPPQTLEGGDQERPLGQMQGSRAQGVGRQQAQAVLLRPPSTRVAAARQGVNPRRVPAYMPYGRGAGLGTGDDLNVDEDEEAGEGEELLGEEEMEEDGQQQPQRGGVRMVCGEQAGFAMPRDTLKYLRQQEHELRQQQQQLQQLRQMQQLHASYQSPHHLHELHELQQLAHLQLLQSRKLQLQQPLGLGVPPHALAGLTLRRPVTATAAADRRGWAQLGYGDAMVDGEDEGEEEEEHGGFQAGRDVAAAGSDPWDRRRPVVPSPRAVPPHWRGVRVLPVEEDEDDMYDGYGGYGGAGMDELHAGYYSVVHRLMRGGGAAAAGGACGVVSARTASLNRLTVSEPSGPRRAPPPLGVHSSSPRSLAQQQSQRRLQQQLQGGSGRKRGAAAVYKPERWDGGEEMEVEVEAAETGAEARAELSIEGDATDAPQQEQQQLALLQALRRRSATRQPQQQLKPKREAEPSAGVTLGPEQAAGEGPALASAGDFAAAEVPAGCEKVAAAGPTRSHVGSRGGGRGTESVTHTEQRHPADRPPHQQQQGLLEDTAGGQLATFRARPPRPSSGTGMRGDRPTTSEGGDGGADRPVVHVQLPTTEEVVAQLRAVLASNGALGHVPGRTTRIGGGSGSGARQRAGAAAAGAAGVDATSLMSRLAGPDPARSTLASARFSPLTTAVSKMATSLGITPAVAPRLLASQAQINGRAAKSAGDVKQEPAGPEGADWGNQMLGSTGELAAEQDPLGDVAVSDAEAAAAAGRTVGAEAADGEGVAGAEATAGDAVDGVAGTGVAPMDTDSGDGTQVVPSAARPKGAPAPALATAQGLPCAAIAVNDGIHSPDSQVGSAVADAGGSPERTSRPAAAASAGGHAAGLVSAAPAVGVTAASAVPIVGAPHGKPPSSSRKARGQQCPDIAGGAGAAAGPQSQVGGSSGGGDGGALSLQAQQQQVMQMTGPSAALQQQYLELLPPVEAARPGDVPDPEAINRIRQQVLDMETRMGTLHPETGRAYVLLARVLEHKGTPWSLITAERALLRAWTIVGAVTRRRVSETGAGAAAVAGVAAAAAAEAGAAGSSDLLGQIPDSFATFRYLLEQIRMKQNYVYYQQQQQALALLHVVVAACAAGAAVGAAAAEGGCGRAATSAAGAAAAAAARARNAPQGIAATTAAALGGVGAAAFAAVSGESGARVAATYAGNTRATDGAAPAAEPAQLPPPSMTAEAVVTDGEGEAPADAGPEAEADAVGPMDVDTDAGTAAQLETAGAAADVQELAEPESGGLLELRPEVADVEAPAGPEDGGAFAGGEPQGAVVAT